MIFRLTTDGRLGWPRPYLTPTAASAICGTTGQCDGRRVRQILLGTPAGETTARSAASSLSSMTSTRAACAQAPASTLRKMKPSAGTWAQPGNTSSTPKAAAAFTATMCLPRISGAIRPSPKPVYSLSPQPIPTSPSPRHHSDTFGEKREGVTGHSRSGTT